MSAPKRIYLVTAPDGVQKLVKAGQKQQALTHVAVSTFQVKVATQDELVAAITAGHAVEEYKPKE